MEQSERGESRAGRAAARDVVVPTTIHAVPEGGESISEAVGSPEEQPEKGRKKARKTKEELIGEPAKTGKAHAEESDEVLLGRARATEKSFAPEAKASRPRIETPEMRFSELQRQTSAYMNEPDEEMLEKAFLFARDAHAGQCRKSGEPFIAHPVEVAIILADLRMDVESICAALLHDTVEDTKVTSEQVAEEFNPQIAQLVDGVTKITRIEVESLSDEQAQTIRKMFVAMNKDIHQARRPPAQHAHALGAQGGSPHFQIARNA